MQTKAIGQLLSNMNLIVNADDFGLTTGVTNGIFEAIQYGIVSSTTMMMNTSATILASHLAMRHPEINVGLHLNISFGPPLTSCPSLVGKNGLFIKPDELICDDSYDEQEIFNEYIHQYQRFVDLVGRKPTHLDSHLYVHQRFPKAKRQIILLANILSIPIREYGYGSFLPIAFENGFKVLPGDDITSMINKFKTLVIRHLGDDWLELMVHPGICDSELLLSSSYNYQRNIEFSTFTSPEIKTFLNESGIELKSFKEIVGERHGID